MKPVYLTFVFALCFLSPKSIFSLDCLVDSTFEWRVLHAEYCDYSCRPTYSIDSYRTIGDTLISNKCYYKLYEVFEDKYLQYLGAMREDSNNVYFIRQDQISEILLYDYNLDEEENNGFYSTYFKEWFNVNSIDSVVIDGQYKKIIYFNDWQDDFIGQYWIEGIGSSGGILKPIIENGTILCGCGQTEDRSLICYYKNNNLIYKNDLYVNCDATNITSTIQLDNVPEPEIKTDHSLISIFRLNYYKNEIIIWDILGQEVFNRTFENLDEITISDSFLQNSLYFIQIKNPIYANIKKILIK